MNVKGSRGISDMDNIRNGCRFSYLSEVEVLLIFVGGVRITLGCVDELPLSLFTVVIGVPDKNKEKLGPLSIMKIEKSIITVLEIYEKQ